MAKLTISDAARVTGVSRVTLHRYIKAGKLSRTPDGLIDTVELLRIGLTLHHDTLQQPVTEQRPVTDSATPAVTGPDTPAFQQLLTVLQRELEAAHAREQAAREREAMLLQMLQQVQQQNQRLLDAGRSPAPLPAPAPAPPPARAPVREDLEPHPAPAPARRRRMSPPAVALGEDLEASTPAFDPTRYTLGKLCPRRHEYQHTGKSLLRRPGWVCLQCDAERAKERRAAKRERPHP